MRNALVRSLAMLFALTFVLAACGDDDSDVADDTPITTTTEEMATTTTGADDAGAELGTIVDTAVEAGGFTTLVSALEAADLVETLSGEGPFTVFAPTDAAFDALPEGILDDLLANPEGLSEVLTYHVVPGELTASDVVGADELETVNGATLPVMVDDDIVMVGDATVIQTDIETSNGVIHVIDAVLTPPAR